MIRKLQCISETLAPPTRKPRQPAASISFQALMPGGFLNVEPPVRSLIGWFFSRYSATSSICLQDVGRIARLAFEQRLGEDPVVRHAAVAIGEAHVGQRQHVDVALRIDGARLDQHVLGFAPVRAGIHAQRAADRARDAAIERKAGDAGVRRRARHLHVGHGGAGAQRDALPRP